MSELVDLAFRKRRYSLCGLILRVVKTARRMFGKDGARRVGGMFAMGAVGQLHQAHGLERGVIAEEIPEQPLDILGLASARWCGQGLAYWRMLPELNSP